MIELRSNNFQHKTETFVISRKIISMDDYLKNKD